MTNIENFPIPSALYKCADYRCARRRSYPADELYFEDSAEDMEAGWYCAGCIEADPHYEPAAPRLDREIARRAGAARQVAIKDAFEQEEK